ncbi:ROK family protein [Blastopirellula sp. JC732]|uniref:ROK family protein n=1 Tax=Blastopirellula sediminis TaxID=2894196 RepID=A0A9X1MQJ6_9BACT|nr:ROK family protein [Blastopirellula sediminis]MCC9606171.1 ROK family protein [Blastopirellula sediminis]MCC9630530.1 ROK family protein [Blastopirellula sediminis]
MQAVKTKQRAIAEAESELIRLVRQTESVSRVELARQLSLAPSTVGLYVDRLVGEGFLQEGRKATSSSGRPPTILELNPEAGHFIGVDFEASQIAITSVDFSQQVLQQEVVRILASDSAARVVEKIEAGIRSINHGSRLLGIGVGVPGVVDHQLGEAVHYQHIAGWQHIPLVEHFTQLFDVPVYIENNIRAMALAEQWFGSARGVSDFVCLGIRSGIGAGVVIDGRLHTGRNGLAGEIGNWPCERPEKGARELVPLERIASVRAILDQLAKRITGGAKTTLTLKRNRVDLEDMVAAAENHEPLTLEVLESAAGVVGRVIAQISLLLNPEKVIVAGPLAKLTDAFLEPIRQVVYPLSNTKHARAPQIVASEFGMHGGALGAAALAVHQWKPSR